MANPNDTFENPRNGDKVRFLITSQESDGEVLKVQIWNRPGVSMPPEHFHPLQIETMEVIEGELGVKLNAGEQMLATILNEHYGELFVTNPPVPVQKLTARLIGGLGKLLGYKGYIPFESN